MKKYLFLFCTLLILCSFNYMESNQVPVNTNDSLTLIFAGDIMGHSPQFNAAYSAANNSFNYDICFKQVKPYIESADWAIANLEVPLAGKPYKGYPSFSSPDELADGLKNAGYDVLLTANNHVVDRGKRGLERTIRTVKSKNLLQVGSYINKNERDSLYPLILEKKGVKIALLNCTYGTNEIPTSYPNIVNYIDTFQISNDILKAKSQKVDLIIMAVHWGIENHLKNNTLQKKYADFFVRKGVNLIIGSHPHVVQNAEIRYSKDSLPVHLYYSVGNSISNQRDKHTDGGIMVKVVIGTNTKKVLNTSYLPVYVYRGVLNSEYQFHLIPTVDYIKNPSNYPIGTRDSTSLLFFDTETRKRLSNMYICN